MSVDFVEKALLLILAALLTGFGAPIVLGFIDQERSRVQKLLDAGIARQAKLIDAQAVLLDAFARLTWQYQLRAIEVSYYHARNDPTSYKNALEKYEQTAGDILGQVRAEISRSLYLASARTYEKLKALYYDVLLPLDVKLRQLIEGESDDWIRFNHYAVYDVADTVDLVLHDLAVELRLTATTASIARAAELSSH